MIDFRTTKDKKLIRSMAEVIYGSSILSVIMTLSYLRTGDLEFVISLVENKTYHAQFKPVIIESIMSIYIRLLTFYGPLLRKSNANQKRSVGSTKDQ